MLAASGRPEISQITALLRQDENPVTEESNITESSESEDTAPSDTGESPPDQGSQGENPEKGDEEIRSLTELAEAIGIEPAALYDLEIKLADDGEPLKLGALKDEIQNLRREKDSVNALKSQIEKEKADLQAEGLQFRQQAETLTQEEQGATMELHAVQAEYASIDWPEFEKTDPGRAALHYQRLVNRHMAAQQKLQQAQGQRQQYASQAWEAYRAAEDAKIPTLVPEWKDPVKFQADATEIVAWASKTYGLSAQDLGQVYGAAQRDMVRKAWLYDKLHADKGKLIKGNLKQLPGKGVSLTRSAIEKSKVNDLIKTAQKTRTRGDQVRAVRALLDS